MPSNTFDSAPKSTPQRHAGSHSVPFQKPLCLVELPHAEMLPRGVGPLALELVPFAPLPPQTPIPENGDLPPRNQSLTQPPIPPSQSRVDRAPIHDSYRATSDKKKKRNPPCGTRSESPPPSPREDKVSRMRSETTANWDICPRGTGSSAPQPFLRSHLSPKSPKRDETRMLSPPKASRTKPPQPPSPKPTTLVVPY